MTNKLQGLTKLAQSIAIYVPTTDGTSEAAEIVKVNAAVSLVSAPMAAMFGGYTITTGDGGYMADNGELVKERVYIIKSHTDALDDNKIDKVIELAEHLKRFMRQECISVEVNGELYFV